MNRSCYFLTIFFITSLHAQTLKRGDQWDCTPHGNQPFIFVSQNQFDYKKLTIQYVSIDGYFHLNFESKSLDAELDILDLGSRLAASQKDPVVRKCEVKSVTTHCSHYDLVEFTSSGTSEVGVLQFLSDRSPFEKYTPLHLVYKNKSYLWACRFIPLVDL